MDTPAALSTRWRKLCSRYLPIRAENSFWRFSRLGNVSDPEQGWKIHISATILTACEALERVGPFLNSRDIQFKAPSLLTDVSRINSGIRHGYSQIGKLITIYPQSDEEAVWLAQQLSELTCHLRGPAIPFDQRFGSEGCLYYRYGAFRQITGENSGEGNSSGQLRHPQGHLVPDDRCSASHPQWVTSPFPTRNVIVRTSKTSPLTKTYHVFRALTQRGRGGVYQAVDSSVSPPRLCVLKEGRDLGEQGWDGRDGLWRVKHEHEVIASLRASGVNAPEIYSTFSIDRNYYLVTEFIHGENLMSFLLKRRRRLPIFCALKIAAEVASVVSQIHAAGWSWRDCKPSNFIMANDGRLRPLDFEGACPRDQPDSLPWGTPGFVPAGRSDFQDIYAIGASLYLLLTGQLPGRRPVPIKELRRNVPIRVSRLIAKLLEAAVLPKLSASFVCESLLSMVRDSADDQSRQVPAG